MIIAPKHSITAAIEGNVIDIIYAGELEIHIVLTYHCATYSMWLGPLVIFLYLDLTAKTLGLEDEFYTDVTSDGLLLSFHRLAAFSLVPSSL